MLHYTLEGKPGLLFAASAAIYDKPNDEPQSDKSNFGKVLFKDFQTHEITIFSKGHRLILGLVIDENNSIIATENGPRGGDEINKIILGVIMAGRYLLMEGDMILIMKIIHLTIRLIMKVMDILNQYFLLFLRLVFLK